MDSEGLSNHRIKLFAVFCGILLVGMLIGCMEKPGVKVTQPPPAPVPAPAPPSAQEPDNAQVRAAAAMVRQGRQHLTQGEPDAAIRILERSVALDSSSGQNYYYLAEAWLMKKNVRYAREFNRLAGIRFAQDAVWQSRTHRQRDRIDALEK